MIRILKISLDYVFRNVSFTFDIILKIGLLEFMNFFMMHLFVVSKIYVTVLDNLPTFSFESVGIPMRNTTLIPLPSIFEELA